MAITHTFVGLPVAGYRASYEWYVRLLGRAADAWPHDSEAIWWLTPDSAIYVVQDRERAGSGLLTIALDSLAELEERLREAAISFSELIAGDAPRRLRVTDPDGNTLTFFEDPARPESRTGFVRPGP